MKKTTLYCVVVLFCLLLSVSCGKKEEAPAEQGAEDFTGARYVRTERAVMGNIEKVLSYSGTVKFDQAMNITPNLSGKIENIYVREGQRVSAGQILARIDKNSLAQAEANFNLAERNYQRSKNLLSDGVIDQRSYEEVENYYISAKTAYDFAVENLEVKAPFAGVIVSVNFKENENYSPMSPNGLFRLINNQSIYVEANVSDTDVKLLRQNQRARIFIESESLDGRITFISPENDRMTGLNRIKIDFTDKSKLSNVRNNQFVTLELIPEFKENVLLIPKTALLANNTVILNKNGRSEFRTVVTGMESRNHFEITKGISNGDVVIVEGHSGLENDYPLQEFGS